MKQLTKLKKILSEAIKRKPKTILLTKDAPVQT